MRTLHDLHQDSNTAGLQVIRMIKCHNKPRILQDNPGNHDCLRRTVCFCHAFVDLDGPHLPSDVASNEKRQYPALPCLNIGRHLVLEVNWGKVDGVKEHILEAF